MNVKDDFPILKRQINGHPLAYLDNAATTQKPRTVIEALVDYYENHNGNVHRGNHTLSDEATTMYEAARNTVANFINGQPEEVIFTRNTTEAINLVAYSWGKANLAAGDTVILSELEHHSNLIPWYILAKETGANLEFIKIDKNYQLDLNHYQELLKKQPVKLVAVTGVSNVLGTVVPVAEIVSLAKKASVKTVVLIDGAQWTPRFKTDVRGLGVDFWAFSAHKMLGPTGVGVLWGRKELLERMPPFITGGSMIGTVDRQSCSFAPIPQKFEAGTPNIAGVIAFKAAIDYLEKFGLTNIEKIEKDLLSYALLELKKIEGVTIYGGTVTGVVSFNVGGVHAHDVSTILDSVGVAVRSGQHCAAPLMNTLGVPATVRASFYLYNTKEDIDQMIVGIKKVKEIFGV